MRRYLLPQGSNSYKANLHCHTTLSDGRLSPEEIRRVYMAKGYSIVAYTDHGVMADCSALETEGFLPLRGCEVEICADAPKGTPHRNIKCCHLCFIALDSEAGQLPSLGGVKYTGASISDLLQRARAAGFFTTYNHPAWSGESAAEYLSYTGMHAMEISNWGSLQQGYEDYTPGVYDDMLRHGKRLYCISTDDNHNSDSDPLSDSFGGFTVIRAEALTQREIGKALLRGCFYASQGPLIHELYVEDGAVHITASPAARIAFSTGSRASRAVNATEPERLTSASFLIPPDCGYFRLTVTDGSGRHANTNAYFTDDLQL